MICVEIEVDDDGSVAVGVVPQAMEAAEEPGKVLSTGAPSGPAPQGPAPEDQEKQYLQPAASIDEALAKAKQLLASGGAPEAPGALWDQAKRDRAAR